MSETPWFDAFESVNTEVMLGDPDNRGDASVAEIMDARVRNAFAHLAVSSPGPTGTAGPIYGSWGLTRDLEDVLLAYNRGALSLGNAVGSIQHLYTPRSAGPTGTAGEPDDNPLAFAIRTAWAQEFGIGMALDLSLRLADSVRAAAAGAAPADVADAYRRGYEAANLNGLAAPASPAVREAAEIERLRSALESAAQQIETFMCEWCVAGGQSCPLCKQATDAAAAIRALATPTQED